jgi:hypothetical protein
MPIGALPSPGVATPKRIAISDWQCRCTREVLPPEIQVLPIRNVRCRAMPCSALHARGVATGIANSTWRIAISYKKIGDLNGYDADAHCQFFLMKLTMPVRHRIR